jgi:hypothetical protein
MRNSQNGWDYERVSSEKMAGRWHVPDVDGVHHVKGWREMHEKMKIQQVDTTTRKLQGAMEEGRWKMWTARCDQVHRKEDDDTITERERTYAKIKKFWVQDVGMMGTARGHEKNGQEHGGGATNEQGDEGTVDAAHEGEGAPSNMSG